MGCRRACCRRRYHSGAARPAPKVGKPTGVDSAGGELRPGLRPRALSSRPASARASRPRWPAAGLLQPPQRRPAPKSGHGTLDAYEVYLAASAARRLQSGRRAVAGAITALLTGIALTWRAPATASPPPADITVTHGHAITCGVLRASATSSLRLTVAGSPRSRYYPFPQITSLAPTGTCP